MSKRNRDPEREAKREKMSNLLQAVSYTHLDVYKRQYLPQSKGFCHRINRTARYTIIIVAIISTK